MKELRDRVAVVTGAASGIGRALAARFAAEGMKLVLADVEEEPLARAESELRAEGAAVRAVATDVARSDSVRELGRRALDAFGAVHVVCNNAGVAGTLSTTWERSDADWRWVLGVNLWGVIHGIQTFVPILLGQGGEGHVVNTASMAGLISLPGSTDYSVSKHGVVTLSESLQHELAAAGSRIKVSVLCPAWVNTRILDAERNRPADLPGGAAARPALAEEIEKQVRDLLAQGMAPERVAEQVVDAIRAERFYILTHPEWKDAIRSRFQDILEERAPRLQPWL